MSRYDIDMTCLSALKDNNHIEEFAKTLNSPSPLASNPCSINVAAPEYEELAMQSVWSIDATAARPSPNCVEHDMSRAVHLTLPAN